MEAEKDKQAEENQSDRVYTLVAAMAGNFILRNGVTELSDYHIKGIVDKARKLVAEIDK